MKKYYLFTKYIKKVLKVKNEYSFIKIQKIKKNISLNDYTYYKDIQVKEFTPEVNTENENPVVTQEKERERALHQTILFNRIFKFSINNYYDLNLLLRDLTMHQLYHQPFLDSTIINKQLIQEKRELFFLSIIENITIMEDLKIFNEILKKIEKNKN